MNAKGQSNMKKLALVVTTFSVAFLGTYVFLDTTKGGDDAERTTITATNQTSFKSDESRKDVTSESEQSFSQDSTSNDENQNVKYHSPNPQAVGGRWFSLTDEYATLRIADDEDGWNMTNNQGDSNINVVYTDGDGNAQRAVLQANKTSWTLIDMNGVVIDGGKVSQ